MAKQPILISFFTHRGGSGEIRGRQVAKYLGAKLNPSNSQGTTSVYVKIQPPKNYPENSYLDIVDGIERTCWLLHNKIGIIASSISGYNFLSSLFPTYKVILIPQHHCNYERVVRENRSPEKIGVVGGGGAIMNPEVYTRFNVIHTKKYKTRKDVMDAYRNLDIQIIWRQTDNPLKNALKIINAASFGIPTVAYQADVYQEMDNYYYPIRSLDEMEAKVKELQKHGWDADRLIEKADEFHISNISKLYLRFLCK